MDDIIKSDNYEKIFKIVLIGDSGVGKSNLISRFASNEFSLETKSTIGVEFLTRSIIMDDKLIKLQVWDTAGQERYRAITSSYYRGAHGIIIVYDITKINTFRNIKKWMDSIKICITSDVPIMIIGNKIDLYHLREVSIDYGIALANQYNLLFVEASALDSTNVELAFNYFSKYIYNYSSEHTSSEDISSDKYNNSSEIIVLDAPSEVIHKTTKCCDK